MNTPGCDFCSEFSGKRENLFHRIYAGNPRSRTLFQSEELVVIPSLGQIAEGYLMILPRLHFRAIGDLSYGVLSRLGTVLDWVGDVLKNEYGRCVAFEHGTRSGGVGGCGIYHAHLHAVPVASVPDPVSTLKAAFQYEEFDNLEEIGSRSAGLLSYLFYQGTDRRLYLFDTGPLPSQYLRKLLADALHEKNWDWRRAGREERLLATIERLSPRFDAVQKSLRSHTNGT